MSGLQRLLRLGAPVIAGAVTAAAVISGPRPACAQAVYCTNCGQEYTQWLNYLKSISQLEKQAALLQNAIKNTTPLQNQRWGAGLADIRAVTALLAQAKSLSYASAGLDTQFAQKFKDYNGYAASKLDNQTMAAKYQQWSEDANSSVKTSLQAASLQNRQIEGDEEALMQWLESQAGGVKGGLDAQQVGNILAAETVRQIQKLRQLVLMNLQLAANYVQNEQDRIAAQKAAWRQFTRYDKKTITNDGKTYRGGE
jgi:P-type conjugative transfer protein TrbJ